MYLVPARGRGMGPESATGREIIDALGVEPAAIEYTSAEEARVEAYELFDDKVFLDFEPVASPARYDVDLPAREADMIARRVGSIEHVVEVVVTHLVRTSSGIETCPDFAHMEDGTWRYQGRGR